MGPTRGVAAACAGVGDASARATRGRHVRGVALLTRDDAPWDAMLAERRLPTPTRARVAPSRA